MAQIRPVAILGGLRTPFARQGTAFSESSNIQMLTAVLGALADRYNLRDEPIGEVAAGAVLKHSRDANISREAVLDSSLPAQVPAYDVQQACTTSLQTAVLVANKIATGQIEAGIAAGVDSASDSPVAVNERLRRILLRFDRTKRAQDRLRILLQLRPSMLTPAVPNVNERSTGLSMGEHCELMVKHWNITREQQDRLALTSHQRGAQAYEMGFFADLVIPFMGLSRDNNLRTDTSLERLARLQPAFDRTSGRGSVTAGNSTPLTDGAAAVLLASEEWASAHHRVPQAWLIDSQSTAVEFRGTKGHELLMAPTRAVARLLSRNGLRLQDFDFYEIHEAFSGQVLCNLAAWESDEYCREELQLAKPLGAIDPTRLNVNGGSVALGHPFGATGARILGGAAKLVMQHRQNTGRSGRALISVCAAGGIGAAAIVQS